MDNKVKTTVSIDKDLYELLLKQMEQDRLKLSQVINRIIAAHFEGRKD